jgi:hypothetical protein
MTIEFKCRCGTVVRAADQAAGKEGRCKVCGQLMRVPTREQLLGAEARELDPIFRSRPSLEDYQAVRQPGRGFWADAARNFVLDAKPVNLIPLAFSWFLLMLMVVMGYALLIGVIGRFLVAGWLFAFCMNVISETAAGEDEVPTFRWEDGLWGDIVLPYFTFLGSLFGVLLPAIITWVAAYYTGSESLGYVATGLAVAGLFAWPAALLVVSIGGISAAFQLDAIALTIARSFFPYLAVVGLIAVAIGLYVWTGRQLFNRTEAGSANFGVTAAHTVIHAWAMIVSMRFIGLYYRHFKNRFPWSAE